jgi:hypothetical protein
LTLRQFTALQARWIEKEKREFMRHGAVAATIANTSMARDAGSAPLEASDFFPMLATEEPAEGPEMDPDAVLAIFQAMQKKAN